MAHFVLLVAMPYISLFQWFVDIVFTSNVLFTVLDAKPNTCNVLIVFHFKHTQSSFSLFLIQRLRPTTTKKAERWQFAHILMPSRSNDVIVCLTTSRITLYTSWWYSMYLCVCKSVNCETVWQKIPQKSHDKWIEAKHTEKQMNDLIHVCNAVAHVNKTSLLSCWCCLFIYTRLTKKNHIFIPYKHKDWQKEQKKQWK